MKDLAENFERVRIEKNPNHRNLCKLLEKYVESSKVGKDRAEENNFIRNNVLIGIVGAKIYILKEQWVNWRIIEKSQDLKMIIKDKANKMQEKELEAKQTQSESTPGRPTPGMTPGAPTARLNTQTYLTDLFQLIISIHIPSAS